MRLIDADALIPTQVHTVVVLKDGREQLESVLYAEQVDDAPTVEPASPWHRVEEPPKEEKLYLTVHRKSKTVRMNLWSNSWGFCYEDSTVEYWMPIPEPPKEDA